MDTNTNPPSGPLAWRAPSRPKHERSTRWYVVAGILTVALIAYALATGSWTFAVVIMLAAAVYFLVRNVEDHRYQVVISPSALFIDGTPYTWETWDAFWILRGENNHYELHVRPKKKNRKDFVVLITDQKPEEVQGAMRGFLREDVTQKEKMFDMILRICKL